MRNLLLATTAVVATALIAPVAMAQTAAGDPLPRSIAGAGTGSLGVRLGGFFEFRAITANDDNDRNRVTSSSRTFGRQRLDFLNELELNVFVDGKAANGMAYGAVFEFQIDGIAAATGNTTAGGTGVNMDEAYVFVAHPLLGTLRFGAEDSAASLLQVRPPRIKGGDDEFDDTFFTSGNRVVGVNDGNDATKIIYLSPQYFGFDFGLSFAANGGEGTTVSTSVSTSSERDRLSIRNEISAGLRYRGTFGPVGVSLSLVGMQADSQARYVGPSTLRSRSTAYSGGAQLTAFGFTVGGEYTWGDYRVGAPGRVAQNRGEDATKQFSVGATYTVPGVGLQLGAFYGQVDFDINGSAAAYRQEIYGFGVAYPLAPGLVTFAGYGHLRDTNTSPTSTDQNAASLGIQRTRNAESYLAGLRLAF